MRFSSYSNRSPYSLALIGAFVVCTGLVLLLLVQAIPLVYAAFTVIPVDTQGDVGDYSSLEINPSNQPVMSYYDRTHGALKLAVCNDELCSGTTISTTIEGGGSFGVYNSLDLTTAGNPVMSYWDSGLGNLKIAVCSNGDCSGPKTIRVVASDGDVGQYNALALNNDGNPVISYFDATNSDLMVIVCGDATCLNGNIITRLDNEGSVGQFSSVAVNHDNLPVISYYDTTKGDLKAAFCLTKDCSSAITRTLDTGQINLQDGVVGTDTSVTINSDNFPVISYADVLRADLRIIVCGDVTCASGNTITTLDSAGFVGKYTSVTMGSSGNPAVSYQDGLGHDDVKLALCSTPTCSGGATIVPVDSTGKVGYFTSIALNHSGKLVISYYDFAGDLKVALDDGATAPTVTPSQSTTPATPTLTDTTTPQETATPTLSATLTSASVTPTTIQTAITATSITETATSTTTAVTATPTGNITETLPTLTQTTDATATQSTPTVIATPAVKRYVPLIMR